jgi:hypothetical protein
MSIEAIRQIFSLDEEEMVYESFECSYWGKAKLKLTGRLYCGDNSFCFYHNMIGI